MTKKVFSLDTKPGIQRDGTFFDKNYYSDGRWVRFQRGRPRKVGGYKQITAQLPGASRGIYVSPQQNFNNIYSGYADGLSIVPVDNNGTGSGVGEVALTGFTASDLNVWQFDTFTDTTSLVSNLLAHPGQNLALIDNNVNTPVLGGDILANSLSPIGVFTDTVTLTTGVATGTIAAANILIGQGQTVGDGVNFPLGTTVVSIVGTTITFSQNALTTGAVSLTFDNNVSVSGGVVVLHPYVFVYGNAGLIRNCAAGDITDWVSSDANAVNVATGKIVAGLPVRGGSNSPSGLFWSLDSLIRVSYSPTTITVAGSAITQYWRYDLISSQSSILSSQCVIEYDGIYYWVGVDRFLMYNGVVKEIPNSMNQNYFFDNLNYEQRQKVWVTKVPRYGEIWWFYPRGDATECTDAIVYNIRENCWYDAGQAIGARRSAGYFSQVFHYPVMAGWDANSSGAIKTLEITDAGTGYTDGTYTNLTVTGGSGVGATVTVEVVGGVVTSAQVFNPGTGYVVGDVLTTTIPAGTGFEITVQVVNALVSLWQHETGTDLVKGSSFQAIESYFETNDLGWVSGGPSQPAAEGENRWLRVERVEPDFVQSGVMQLYIVGRPYAQSSDVVSDPYHFGPTTPKIDMREQRRELRLRFSSNEAGGDYQAGRIMISADFGDVRGY